MHKKEVQKKMASHQHHDSKAFLKQASTTYPRVTNLSSRVRERVNTALKRTAFEAIPDYDPGTSIIQATNSYTVTVNLNDVLSVKFDSYYYPEMAAHGVTGVSAVTLDLRTGNRYPFECLFRTGVNYEAVINRIIEEQIVANQIPMLKPFEGVSEDQEYYLTPDTLVIFYPPYEYTPGAYGVLEFKIPYTQIREIIDPMGPIGRIMNMQC